MSKKSLLLILLTVLGVLVMGCASNGSYAQTCTPMNMVKDSGKDATPAIADCLKRLEREGTLQLLPGTYQLLTPLVIDRPVTIETAPVASGQACSKFTGAYCAVLAIGQMPPQATAGVMPIEVAAQNVRFHSMAIIGPGNGYSPWGQRICLDPHTRPLGGGVRIRADSFQMTNVLLKDVGCYTAMEVSKAVKNVRISNNVIAENGNHKSNLMWSDGITIHDAVAAVVENNIFKDNTDVQLIFGGCQSCLIRDNKFYHSPNFSHASFAELMLHAWPTTSGNFAGSIISGNSINCGRSKRCGYGVMIGGEPWYSSKASGGMVTGNVIKNALMGLNVDRLTGKMAINDNVVARSGGIANSDCGKKIWPPINISPESKKFLVSNLKKYNSVKTGRCLIGRAP